MYLRTVKVRSSSGSINEYVRLVEAYRDNGKVKQRTLADLGRKDLLVEILPKLQRFLGGDRADTAEVEDPDFLDASTWGPVLVVRTLFDQLGLWTILDAALGKAKGVPFADRAFVLVANRLIRPASLGCAAGGVGNSFSLGNPHGRVPGLHYISRSGLSRSGMVSFNAARILACSGLGRATRRRASFLPSVVSRRMSPI